MGPRAGASRRVRGICVATMMLVTLAAGAVSPSPAAAQTEGLLPPGDWASWQEAEMLDMIDRAEAAFATMPTDRAGLQALGYVDIIAVTAGYEHWVNVDMMNDEHVLDPAYPESLVIQRSTREIHAAMLFLDQGNTMDTIPSELRWWPGWHAHPELCTNEQGQVVGGTLPGQNFCPPGSEPAIGPPMMHVWVVDNACNHRFGGLGVGGFHCDEYGTPLPEAGFPFGMDVEADVDGAVSIDTVFGSPLELPTGSEGVCNPDGTPTQIMGSFSADHGGGHSTISDAHAMGAPADLVVTDDGAICGTINLEIGGGEITGATGDEATFRLTGVTAELDIDGTGAFEQHIPDACALSVDIGELSGTMSGDGAPNSASLSASGVSVAAAPDSCGYYGAMLDFALDLPSTGAAIDLNLSVNWNVGGGGHEHDA